MVNVVYDYVMTNYSSEIKTVYDELKTSKHNAARRQRFLAKKKKKKFKR